MERRFTLDDAAAEGAEVTAAEAVVGARYRVTGGRVIHVVGERVGSRLTSLCRSDSRYRGGSEQFNGAHLGVKP